MVERVKLLISKDFAEIKSSRLSLELLKCYSALYLGGKQPRACEKSMLAYHNRLKADGLKKAQTMKEKTNICKKKGIVYISNPMHKHVDYQHLSDNDAAKLLKLGVLKEKDFEQLPENYNVKPKKEEQKEKPSESKEEKPKSPKPKAPKPKAPNAKK